MKDKLVEFVADESESANSVGVRSHIEAVGSTKRKAGAYEKCVKRNLDFILSLGGIVVLYPVFFDLAI